MIRPRPTRWAVGAWRVVRLGGSWAVRAPSGALVRDTRGPRRPSPRRYPTRAAALAAARRLALLALLMLGLVATLGIEARPGPCFEDEAPFVGLCFDQD